MKFNLRNFLGIIPACAICSALAAGDALAADASGWVDDLNSSVRLIAAQKSQFAGSTTYRAGIEFKLSPGWHTYWRYPGDAGVPARFDFKGSANLKAVEVLWPAPHRYREGELDTIGYTERLILPLHITPHEPGKPVRLQLKIDYAVCEKLCVPVQAELGLVISGKATAHDATLAAAEALVPEPSQVGAQSALAIHTVRRETGGERPRVVVDVAAPAGTKVELFAEGPTPEWALPVPEPVPGAPGGLQRFAFDLGGLPPGAKAEGAALKLTAVSGKMAIEVTVRLD